MMLNVIMIQLSAKNALINHNVFSPAQLIFKRSSNLPNTISGFLPSLETPVKSVGDRTT